MRHAHIQTELASLRQQFPYRKDLDVFNCYLRTHPYVTKPLAENNEHVCCGTLIHTPHWSHLLIVAHRKAKTWLPAGGGHLEIDEHPKDCIVRECHEELGCSIERSQLILIDYFSYVLKVPNARCHIHHDLFYRYEVKEMFEPAQSDEFAYECSAWKWVPLEEALTLISYPHITTLIQHTATRRITSDSR